MKHAVFGFWISVIMMSTDEKSYWLESRGDSCLFVLH